MVATTIGTIAMKTVVVEATMEVAAVAVDMDEEETAVTTVVIVTTMRMTRTTTIMIAVVMVIMLILLSGILSPENNNKISSMPAVLPTPLDVTTTTITNKFNKPNQMDK